MIKLIIIIIIIKTKYIIFDLINESTFQDNVGGGGGMFKFETAN